MARGKVKIKTPDQAETPISSMIDVVFLLIIFFVVTASIDKEIEDERVILAEAPHGRPIKKKDPRSLVINVRQDGTFSMGMRTVTLPEIKNELEQAKLSVSNPAENLPIIVRGDYHAQHYYIKQVMDTVKSTGLYKVRFNAQQSSE